MKHKTESASTHTLVYAYGCGAPIAGMEAASAEVGRQRKFWDRLVEIDQITERRTWDIAAADSPAVAEYLTLADRLGGEIDQAFQARRDLRAQARAKVATPDQDAALDALIPARREAKSALFAALKVWRKDFPDHASEIYAAQKAAVIEARQNSGCYWGNYNRVLQSYETAKKLALKKGRRIRPTDPTRRDGCLTVQIQRTQTGLGASMGEILGGKFAGLVISSPPVAAYDPLTPRGERSRLQRTHLTMRVDAAGNRINVPLTLHRLPPDGARIKSAQLTWRPEGERMRYQLALTVSAPSVEMTHLSPSACGVDLGWRLEPDGSLLVATVAGSGGEITRYHLPQADMGALDQVERLSGHLSEIALNLAQTRYATLAELPDDLRRPLERWRPGLGAGHVDQSSLHDAIQSRIRLVRDTDARADVPADLRSWYDRYRHLAPWRDNLRAKVARRRLDLYRRIGLEIAQRYALIGVEDMDLSQMARTRTRQDADNPLHPQARAQRVRAAVHILRAEIQHQASKTGAQVIRADGPSTGFCLACGTETGQVNRALRHWVCQHCASVWDQDVNAARNLLSVADGSTSGPVRPAKRGSKIKQVAEPEPA